PAGWLLRGRANDGLRVEFQSADGVGRIVVAVTPQEAVMLPEAAPQIALVAGKFIRDNVKVSGSELLYGPRVEDDPGFFLKVRDRQRRPDGRITDRVQLWRVMHLEMVHVVAVSEAETEEAAAAVHEAAAKMLAGARLGAGPRPTFFRKARIRLTVPTDWIEQRSDDPNGVVATYTSPDRGNGDDGGGDGARIVVRAKVIPRAARDDARRKEILVDELVDAERNAPIVPGAGKPREEERGADPRYLRTVRRVIDVNGKACHSDLRCQQVGDVLIAVAAIAPQAVALDDKAFEAVSKAADELAASIKPLEK
ncbi:MAG: hypothetical protein WBD40_02890, partial [Tepidisphaeraceae bacterium]